jgi:hypothetical protein
MGVCSAACAGPEDPYEVNNCKVVYTDNKEKETKNNRGSIKDTHTLVGNEREINFRHINIGAFCHTAFKHCKDNCVDTKAMVKELKEAANDSTFNLMMDVILEDDENDEIFVKFVSHEFLQHKSK